MVSKTVLYIYKKRVECGENPTIYMAFQKNTSRRTYYNGYIIDEGKLLCLFWDEWSNALGSDRSFEVVYSVTGSINARRQLL